MFSRSEISPPGAVTRRTVSARGSRYLLDLFAAERDSEIENIGAIRRSLKKGPVKVKDV